MFFDYDSDVGCACCQNRCLHGYLPPLDQAYATIARCHVSLAHLQSTIHTTWLHQVEANGAVPVELTRWLVEIAKMLPRPVAPVTRLYEAAITTLNAPVCAELASCGAKLPPGEHSEAAVNLVRAVQLASQRMQPCSEAVRVFVQAVGPNDEIMHYLLLNVLIFGACIPETERHVELVEAVLGKEVLPWRGLDAGAVCCVLRGSRAPAAILRALVQRGITSFALPPWKFESMCNANTFCNPDGTLHLPINLGPQPGGGQFPAIGLPFNAYAILFRRVDTLDFRQFVAAALVLHEHAPTKDFAPGELEVAAVELLGILLQRPRSLKRSKRVLDALRQIFPLVLLPLLPCESLLYSGAGLAMQMALATKGVVAERCTSKWDFFTGDFLDIKLKTALVLAHSGVTLGPAFEQDPFYRLLIEVITGTQSDAPWRFLQLCLERQDAVRNLPQFTKLALRIMYLYNKGETASAPMVLESVGGFGMRGAVAATAPLCSKFSHMRFRAYPLSCRGAIWAFLLAVRRAGLPRLPTEVLLAILERAPSAAAFGTCRGPSAAGERFPMTDVEIQLLATRGFFDAGARIGAA